MKTAVASADPGGTWPLPPVDIRVPRVQLEVPAYALDLLDQLSKAQQLVLMLAGGDQVLREQLITLAEQHRALLRQAIVRSLS